MNREELISYVRAELSRIKRTYKSIPMPQDIVGERRELEFILELLEEQYTSIIIARAVIMSENLKAAEEESNNGSK